MSNETPDVTYAVAPTARTVAPPAHLAAGEIAPEPPFVACGKLTAALAAARDRCKVAGHDRTNEHHKYKYTSADAIMAAANDALEASGLAILPQRQALGVAGSGQAALYVLNRTFILSHSSGEFTRLDLEGWPVIAGQGRPLDKAFAIAMTSSMSYMVQGLLQISRGEADDMTAREDRKPKQAEGPAPTEPRLSEAEYLDLTRSYHKRAEECDTVDCLRQVYDDVRADKRVALDRRAIQAFIAEQKKRILTTEPAATTSPARTTREAPAPAGEPVPF